MTGVEDTRFFQYTHPATGCARCPDLARSRQTVVWGRGPQQAEIMAIGEAPGYNEDVQGIPFVGQSGNEMHQILQDLNPPIAVNDIHIGNVLMCKPPGNRDPEPEELANCSPWLVQHVRDVRPRALLLFGRYALQRYFDKNTVAETRGLMYQWQCDGCGGLNHEHHPRFAIDGMWEFDESKSRCRERRRLVVAVYHPANTFRGRDPEHRVDIVIQLQRMWDELNATRPEVISEGEENPSEKID